MPVTPFHLGPGLLLAAILHRYADLTTILVASILVDVRTILVIAGVLGGPLHGPFHTIAGATAVGLVAATMTSRFFHGYAHRLRQVGVPVRDDTRSIVIGGVTAAWLHVLLDAVLYTDVVPFAPIRGNPFLGVVDSLTIYLACGFAFLVGAGFFAFQRYRANARDH